jgi:hypothetical protein
MRVSAPVRVALLLTGAATLALYALLAAAMLRAIIAAAAAGFLYWRGDFGTMWRAGLLIRAGDMATLYDRHLFDAWIARTFGQGKVDISWLYTPPMGLVALAVAALPFGFSFWAWRVGTLLLAAALLRGAGLRWWVIAAGLLGPVELYDMLLGQNGLLTGGLLAASLLMMETRPILAGALAGCLCIKPQIAVLLPAVLSRRRLRAALLAAVATVAVLAALATAVEGFCSWRLFFTLAQPNAGRILRIPFGHEFQMTGFTVFLMARSLHASLGLAWAAQGICAAAALLAGWWLWREPSEARKIPRMAMTVCLSMLAMPYGFSYDLVAFSVAMAALMPGARPVEVPVLAALWLWPGFTSLITAATGVALLPLAAVIGGGLAARQYFDRAAAIH